MNYELSDADANLMNGSRHISNEGLADLAENLASPEQRAKAEGHLAGCSLCASQFYRLQHVVELMKTDRSEDAPRDVIAYAVNLFKQAGELREPSLARRLVAALTFDSFRPASAFGTRSVQAAARQLIYSAEEFDIELRLTALDDRWVVAGQVMRDDCPGGTVEIQGDGGSASVKLTDTCEFTLPALPHGDYLFRVLLNDVTVEIPLLKVTA